MIVAGSDLSRGSEAALRLASAWAREHGGSLRVVHALEGSAHALAADERERIALTLREQARRAAGDGVESLIAESDALAALAPSPDRVIVTGTEGGSATLLRRAGHVPMTLAGSLPAGARLLAAPPAWAAPSSRRHRPDTRRREPGPAFERVLVACALDARDARLVGLACEIASASQGTELHLVHVIDIAAGRHHPPSARAALRDATDDLVRRADDALRDLAADAVPLEMAARRDVRLHVVRQGPVERDLGGLATSQSIDLIVAGAGPVAARLMSFTPSALLVSG